MSDISKLKIGDIEYDIKDTSARGHISNQLNPHGVTKAQIGLSKVENLSPQEVLNQMTVNNINVALGYVPANRDNLEATEIAASTALENSMDAKNIASQKIDSNEDSTATAIVNFINGVRVSNATISYNSNSDTVIFN